jgi:hypothetical protein
MCSAFVRKEANRLNWMIKGQLIDKSESDTTIEKLYDSYFKRLWGNNESYIHEDGFEKAYEIREAEVYEEEREKVAHLGYD